MTQLYLWAGLNWEGISEDEANGGGRNFRLDVMPFGDARVFIPLIETADYWAACPDVTIPRESRSVVVACEPRTVRVRSQ
jgi:hypothetical protein